MEQTPQPSLKKVMFADYSTSLVILIPVAAWLMLAMLGVMSLKAAADGKDLARGLEGMQISLVLAVAGTLFAILFVNLRLRMYRRRFAEGVEVPASIASVFTWRGRASVSYAYDYMGQSYKGKGAVMRISYRRPLGRGVPVTLIVDPQNPKRSLVRDFYL